MTNFVLLGDIHRSAVSQELVELAGKHVSLKVCYVKVEASSKDDIYIEDGSTDETVGNFWEELNRLQKLITVPLDEPILPDNYPVYQGYLYVTNGNIVRTFIDGVNQTVGSWKAMRIEGVTPVHEVRSCDLIGRTLRKPLEKITANVFSDSMKQPRKSFSRTVRRNKKTYKINKAFG